MKTKMFNKEIETSYTVIKNQETGKVERIRYFVSNVPKEINEKFSSWIYLGWDKYAKDAFVKTDAVAIIGELKSMGINC
jgi:hypothetical protein